MALLRFNTKYQAGRSDVRLEIFWSAIRGAGLMLMLFAMVCPAQPALAADVTEYLGPGDAIKISVFQNPDLSTETRVSARGTISFPLLGEVSVGGMTPAAAESRLAELLKKGNFILNPQVNLVVTQVRSRQVSVLGQVNRPGKYALEDFNSRLIDLLALAGGVSPVGADSVTIVSVRDGKTKKTEIDLPAMYRSGDLTQNIEVQAGDTLYVQRAPVFYIYGEVQRAGVYRLEPNMTVTQALSLGGGLTVRGTERGIRVKRFEAGKMHQVEVKMDDFLRADDVVFVREALF
jgi:polysaccharide export outer membrane protein